MQNGRGLADRRVSMVGGRGGCSSNDNKRFRRSDSLSLIQHYIYKQHCINCNVLLHSMIAVNDVNRYELHFRQFMLISTHWQIL